MNEKQLLVLEELKSLALRYQAEFGHRLPITGELGKLLTKVRKHCIQLYSSGT